MRRAPRTRFLLAAVGLTGLFWLAATPVCAGPATDRLREFFSTVNGVLVDPAIQSKPLEKVVRIKRLVTDVADVRGAAAAVLDKEWAQFRRGLRQGSYAALLAQLRAKLGEATRMFAQASHVPTPAEAAVSRPSPAPRVAARAPSSGRVAKAAAPAIAKAPPIARAPAVVTAPPVAKASTPAVAKPSTPVVAKASTPPPARPSAPMVAKAAAPSPATPPRTPRLAMAPVVPPPADALSPPSPADITA